MSYRCTFEVVWCTQYRLPVISGPIADRLGEIIVMVATEKDALLRKMQLSANLVHIVIDVPPQFGIHRLVKAVKAQSARELRSEFPSLRTRLPSLWTNAYLAGTVGAGIAPSVKAHYLEQQRVR